MKNRFAYFMMTLLAGVAVCLASCTDNGADDEPTVEPVFPAKVEVKVDQGMSHTLEFTPTHDCIVSIPDDKFTLFQLVSDNDVLTTKVSGKAGEPMKVTVQTKDTGEKDNEYTCDVTLSMAGEERVIATIVRTVIGREMKFYLCTLEDGTFSSATESNGLNYTYDTVAAESVELIWPEGLNCYSYPVLVEANFKWHVVADSCPEWLELSAPAGEAGDKVELRLTGSNELEPKQATILFCDHYNKEKTFAFTVSMPDCKNRFQIEGFAAESRFNAKGQFRTDASGTTSWMPADVGASGSVTDIEGTVMYVYGLVRPTSPLLTEEYMSTLEEDTAWINAELAPWSEDGGNLQTRDFTITLDENNGVTSREGVVYVLPKSAVEANGIVDAYSLMTSATEFDAKYDQYRVTYIKQAVADVTEGAVIAINASDMEGHAVYTTLGENQTYELSHLIPGETIPEGFFLHYTSGLGASDYTFLKADRAYTVKFYDAEYKEMTDEDSWLSILQQNSEEENGFRIVMNPGLDKYDAHNYGCTSDHLGFIVLFDKSNDKPFALIRCEYTEPVRVDEIKFVLEFANPAAVSGASIIRVNDDLLAAAKADPVTYSWLSEGMKTLLEQNLAAEYRVDMYILKYDSANNGDATLKVDENHMMVMAYGGVTMNGGETGFWEKVSTLLIDVADVDPTSDITPRVEFYGRGGTTVCMLYCVINY